MFLDDDYLDYYDSSSSGNITLLVKQLNDDDMKAGQDRLNTNKIQV